MSTVISIWAISAAAASAPPALQNAAAQSLQEVVVTGTPLSGAALDIDKLPGNAQVLSAGDLTREGSASLTRALNSALSSISIADSLDDPFQPDILYRGFEASPVLGTPQGLAVYQNGVRINEAFGDTVNWDLLPDIAIDQVELVSSSPLYGLNALGGAIAVTMKNGFTAQGENLELSAGSYGSRSAVAQIGKNVGMIGLYVALKGADSDGWRNFSNDRIRSLYAVLSLHTGPTALDLSYTRADDWLHGQGAAPVQELAINRSLVFTGPQSDINTLNFFTLNGSLELSNRWSLHGVAYYRDYGQSVANGNTTNYTACSSMTAILCQPDGVTPLMNAAGQRLPDLSDGGAIPIGENDAEIVDAWGRGLTFELSYSGPLFGHSNRLTFGAGIDDASTSFYTGAQIGVISSQLLVLPSDLLVDTPENSPAALANGDATPVRLGSVNRNSAAYLSDTLDLATGLSITASGRYNVAPIELTDRLGPNLTGSNRFVHFNPAVGVTYQIVPTATLYAGVSTNTRSPTASEIECSNPLSPCLLPTNLAGDPPNLRQVVSHTYESGIRGSASWPAYGAGALTWKAGVFRTLLHDDIYGIATSVSQGFFQNIGDTRRQGIEAGLTYRDSRWSTFLNYSFVQATFRSRFLVPSPSNPLRNALGDIEVEPDDRLPGVPEHRLKLGLDCEVTSAWTVGTIVNVVSSSYYVGDEANLLAPISGYTVLHLHSAYRLTSQLKLFGSIDNLFSRRYATSGILSDPTGVGAPGIPPNAVTNGAGVDNRFLSPAAPLEWFAGLRLTL